MTAAWYEWQNDTLLLQVSIQPRASRDQVAGVQDRRLKPRVTAPPVEGAANEHLTALLAREFRVPKAAVKMLSGETGREKRLAVHGPRSRPAWFDAPFPQASKTFPSCRYSD